MLVREVLTLRSGGQQTVTTPFPDYCDHLKIEVFRTLGDIEALCEQMTGQKREDWTDAETAAYERLRTRLLNLAGSVAR